MSNYFSKNLKYLREARKLSQNKLAEMIGVNQTTIARWEDDNRTPNLDNAVDVSRVLNVPLTYLVGKDLSTGKTYDSTTEDLKKVLEEKGLLDKNGNLDSEKIDKVNKIYEVISQEKEN